MGAGKRDKIVRFEHQVVEPNAFYGDAGEWETKFEAWAHVRPLSAREVARVQRMEAIAEYAIEIDFPFTAVTSAMRIRLPVDTFSDDQTGRTLNIVEAIKPEGRDRTFVLLCKDGE